MGVPYVEEFMFRGRDPVAEPGMLGVYHVTLAQWFDDPVMGPQQRTRGPLTPEQATALGYPLNKILGDVAAQAARDVAILEERLKVLAEEKHASETALSQTIKELSEAVAAKDAELAIATAPPEGPSNPLLNTLTFGVFGN